MDPRVWHGRLHGSRYRGRARGTKWERSGKWEGARVLRRDRDELDAGAVGALPAILPPWPFELGPSARLAERTRGGSGGTPPGLIIERERERAPFLASRLSSAPIGARGGERAHTGCMQIPRGSREGCAGACRRLLAVDRGAPRRSSRARRCPSTIASANYGPAPAPFRARRAGVPPRCGRPVDGARYPGACARSSSRTSMSSATVGGLRPAFRRPIQN